MFFERVIYTESHDEVANGQARVPEEIQPGEADSYFAKKRAVLGMALTLTSPGIPMLFQGQEFLEDEYFQDTEGLDWEQKSKNKGIKNLVKDLIRMRTHQDSTEGLRGQFTKIIHFNQNNKVIGYARASNENYTNSTVVLINLSNVNFDHYSFGFPTEGDYKVAFNSDWKGYDEKFTDTPVVSVTIDPEAYDNDRCKASCSLPAYTALIICPA